MTPLINILIRSHRPALLESCLASIDYDNTNVILYQDRGPTAGYDYNLFCNDLKERVTDGWFFFLDDDDTVIPGALNRIAEYLTEPDRPVVCQFMRGMRVKPYYELMQMRVVKRGHIGMPCLFLHVKHKNVASFDNTEYADFNFIYTVSRKLNCKFVTIPVVKSERRNYGK